MLRIIVVLATAYLGLVAAESPVQSVVVDKTFLEHQKSIYQLYWHVSQPTTVVPELYNTAKAYNIADHVGDYKDSTAVTLFNTQWSEGMLPRGEIFSVFYPQHLKEAKMLFDVFYCAKDFNTFYNTAVWARFNVNEALFTYALTAAVIHRPDTRWMKLPPLYELMPHYFFNNEIIQQAYQIKMGDVGGVKKGVTIKYHDGGVSDITINANYSGWYMTHDYHSEEKLTYFTEDVGLNSFYFYFKHEFPFWRRTITPLMKNLRGEYYFFGHKQILARYYLERLSNGMGEIDVIDWHQPILTGYHPTMMHANGLPFPHRPSSSMVPFYKYKYVQEIGDVEHRISEAIDSGFVLNKTYNSETDTTETHKVDIYKLPEGFSTLASIIEGNADSVNYQLYNSLDHLAKNILGFNLEPMNKYQIVPSALEMFVTSPRDPAFYRIYKKIVEYMLKYKSNLPSYTSKELLFPGVVIESVAVDKLMTFFDHFDSEISNGLPVVSHKEAESLNVKVRQYRLNHKPYTYHITVNSQTNAKCLIRIFLGPKYDVHGHEVELSDNWMNFVELDQWIVDLKSGINKIERSSHQSYYVIPDEVTGPTFWKRLERVIQNGESYSNTQRLYGFPDRIILPKGKKEGMPFKLFVVVSSVDDATMQTIETPVWGTMVTDSRSMGYPFDRPIQTTAVNKVPNIYEKDVMIYHKQAEELNITV